MKKYKLLQKLSIFAFAALSLIGCTEDIMDDINERNSDPKDAPAKFIVAELLTSTAFSTVGGDFSLYASVYMEHEAGTHNQMYNAETRQGEPTSSNTYNNVWGNTYSNIKNAKIVIAKCSEGGEEEGSEITLGVAKTLLAYNAAVLTDLFGDVPFSQAGEINSDGTPKYMQPIIDKQENIYTAIFKLLDEAIVHFDTVDAGVYGALGSADYIYGGKKDLWKKAAYGLKARYTMRLLGRSADKNADLEKILNYVSKSFASAGEELKYAQYDGDANVNPLFGFSYSRAAFGASRSLLNKFKERNDPRANQYFGKVMDESSMRGKMITDSTKVSAAPNGEPEQMQLYYDIALADISLTAPTLLLSYHEILFLQVEALCRLNRELEGKDILKKAIAASFANLETTINSALHEWAFDNSSNADLGTNVASAYFATSVAPSFDTDPLKETLNQKYLAFAGASGESIEAYNDYRRTQEENLVTLANAKNATQFPQRFSYGSYDVLANVNVKAAYGDGQYVYTEKVWWAGGNR